MIRKLTFEDMRLCSALHLNQLAAGIIAALALYSATAVADADTAGLPMEQVVVFARRDDKSIKGTGKAASLLQKQPTNFSDQAQFSGLWVQGFYGL